MKILYPNYQRSPVELCSPQLVKEEGVQLEEISVFLEFWILINYFREQHTTNMYKWHT